MSNVEVSSFQKRNIKINFVELHSRPRSFIDNCVLFILLVRNLKRDSNLT